MTAVRMVHAISGVIILVAPEAVEAMAGHGFQLSTPRPPATAAGRSTKKK